LSLLFLPSDLPLAAALFFPIVASNVLNLIHGSVDLT
jgi:hypothetical protein